MGTDYTIDKANAEQDAWSNPATLTDPVAYSSEDSARVTAKYFGQPVLEELLALINSRVSSKAYNKVWTCIAGLNVGDPVYISAADTVALALATTEATAKVVGFVRYKPTTTTCLIEHFQFKTGLAGLTAGADVFLSNAGGFAATAGTFERRLGVALDTDEAIVSAEPRSRRHEFSYPCDGRLTLETGVPVSTTDQTAKTSVYFTPYKGNSIAIYNPTKAVWEHFKFTEITGTVPGGTATNHDVWIYDNAGTLTMAFSAWGSDTARTTDIVLQDGIYCKDGQLGYRYVGTIRTTSVSGQCEDSTSSRYVWNMYNRVTRSLTCTDSTGSWAYNTAAWRQANNSTTLGTARVDFVCGLNEDAFDASRQVLVYFTGAAAAGSGIALDAINTNHAQTYGGYAGAGDYDNQYAKYVAYSGIGYHYLQNTEYGAAAGTTWYGSNAASFNGALVVKVKG